MKRPDTITSPPNGYLYRQPETGIPFHFFTWRQIVEEVGKHRKGMGLDLSDGWVDRLGHDICEQNLWWGCPDDDRPMSSDTPLALAGRAAWKSLHEFTEAYPDAPTDEDISRARYWMSKWRETIPRFGGCTCREDWARLEAVYPPDYSGNGAFARWAVVSHDAINRKIGHPIWNQEWWDEAVASGLNVFT